MALWIRLVSCLSALLLLAACASPASQLGNENAAPTAAPASPGGAPASETATMAPAKPAGPEDEAALIEAAKQEGKVSWIAVTSDAKSAEAYAAGFKEKYSLPDDFTVEWISLDTARTITRINDELKADKLSIDIPWIGVPAFFNDLQQRGELMPYSPPEWQNFSLVEKAGLPSNAPYYYVPNGYTFAVGWNSKFYDGELTSWLDLLNPEFKGKIQQGDVRKGETYTYTYIGVKSAAGDDFFQKLGELQPSLTLPQIEMMQKAISGEYPIWSFAGTYIVYRQMRDHPDSALEVRYPKEGVVLLPITMGILAKAPHPNAAKLFMNYMMSEEGQLAVVKNDGLFSLRANLPVPPEVAKYVPPVEQLNTIPLDYTKISTDDIAREQQNFRTDLQVD